MPILLVIFVFPLVFSSILPGVYSLAVHAVVQPLSCVTPPVRPHVRPESVYLAYMPFPLIIGPVRPHVSTVSLLLALMVLSHVLGTIAPDLSSFPMLQIVLPQPLVLRAVGVQVCSHPVRLVILPDPLEDVSVHMIKLPLPAGAIVFPFALILRAVDPHLHAYPLPHASLPFPVVDCATGESVRRPLLYLVAGILNTNRFLRFEIVLSLAALRLLLCLDFLGLFFANRVAAPPLLYYHAGSLHSQLAGLVYLLELLRSAGRI